MYMSTKPLPPTLTENRALERSGLFIVSVHKNGMRAMRLRAERPLTVGRAPDCDVQIDTQLLSRVHFSVRSGDPVVVEDLQSSNGTKVNGRPIAPGEPTPIDVGSLIEAGGIFFVLKDYVPDEAIPEVGRRASSRRRRPLAARGGRRRGRIDAPPP